MPKTIVNFGRDSYHKSCLSDEEIKDAHEIPIEEIGLEEVCNGCMELLRSDDAPEDPPEAP